jgi:dTDP-glucose 4,6-dehydratase
MTPENCLRPDLDHILDRTAGIFGELRGSRLFITGGTGFFGCWLLESALWANQRLGLGTDIVVLTRGADRFSARYPHLVADRSIRLYEGDVRSGKFPDGEFSHIIHAATPASAALNVSNPLLMLDTIIDGTRKVLDFAAGCGTRKLLLTSSGAVYGKQPPELTHVPESYEGKPDTMNPRSAYAEGKRVAELLCAIYSDKYAFETKIARCFAFTGPYLPLDAHFAAGNFVRDHLQRGTIRVSGDGTPVRSYMYAADLMIWLWTIFFKGDSCRPYNVGSAEDVSIAELARAVAKLGPVPMVEISRPPALDGLPERYVPDVSRAQTELKLEQTVSLTEGLRRTSNWARGKAVA